MTDLHIHTADYDLMVIEGTMKHWRQGEEEATAKPLRVGSYWFQPGEDPHADSCLTDTCVMLITWSGPRRAVDRRPGLTQECSEYLRLVERRVKQTEVADAWVGPRFAS